MDGRIGGAGAAAAAAAPEAPIDGVNRAMEVNATSQAIQRNKSTVADDLIAHLNDDTTVLTIAAHGSYPETATSYTCNSYVIETSLYGEIFYVIKIKYIKLFFTNSEQLVHLFTPYSIHSIIETYDKTTSYFNQEAIGRVCDANPQLKALRENKPEFIKKLGNYIRDLLLKGSWGTLRTYMGELYDGHINHLSRLENSLTACTIYPPGSTVYTRKLTMKKSDGKREEWSGVYDLEDRTEEEPFDTLFVQQKYTTTKDVVEASKSDVYVFISCGESQGFSPSPIEKEQNQRRLDFNESRDDSSGPEPEEGSEFDIDTVDVQISETLVLDMSVRTREKQLNRGDRWETDEQGNAYIYATASQENYRNPDASIRCDDNHPIGVTLAENNVEIFNHDTGPSEESDGKYVFDVKVTKVQRSTPFSLLEPLVHRYMILRQYYIKIEGEDTDRIPSLVPVFSLLHKYIPGTTAYEFIDKMKENSINTYIYSEWINRHAEEIFNQEEIGSFYDFLGEFTELKEITQRKIEYREKIINTHNILYTLRQITKGILLLEDAKVVLVEIIDGYRRHHISDKAATSGSVSSYTRRKQLTETQLSVFELVAKSGLLTAKNTASLSASARALQGLKGLATVAAQKTFADKLKQREKTLDDIFEKAKALYDSMGDDPLDTVGGKIEAILDEEELKDEETEEKPEEVEQVTQEMNALILSCLAQRGSSRKTRSNQKASKRKTKSKPKPYLTRRKYKKAEGK